MLAMEAQTLQGIRQPSSSLTTIAGKPAPTGAGQAAGCAVNTKPCRSELARDGGPDTAGHQTALIIVDDHRGQARSHNGPGKPQDVQSTQKPVGASLLAMEAQTTRGIRQPASSFKTIAGKPAPTGAGQAAGCAVDTKTCGSELARDGGTDTAGHQQPASSFKTIAGKPAPTMGRASRRMCSRHKNL